MLNRREFLTAVSLLPTIPGIVGAATPNVTGTSAFIPQANLTFFSSLYLTGRAVAKSTAKPRITQSKLKTHAYGIHVQWPTLTNVGDVRIEKLVYFEPSRMRMNYSHSLVIASSLFCMELRGLRAIWAPPERQETDPIAGSWYELRNVRLLFKYYDKWHARLQPQSQLKGIKCPNSQLSNKSS